MAVTLEKLAVAAGKTAPAPDSPTGQQWQMWVEDALMLVEARRLKVAGSQPDQMKLDYVVREAVVAHIRRPDDATQVTISVDDGSSSRSYQSSKGRVVILDEWWSILGLDEASGAFSIDSIGFLPVHLYWCAIMLGANYCSCGVDIAGKPIYEGADHDPWQ